MCACALTVARAFKLILFFGVYSKYQFLLFVTIASSVGFINWVCSVRTKTNRCPAWVKQYETSYIHSAIQHNHPADPTKLHRLKVSAKVKTKAAENVFRPAGQIVKEVIRESNVSVKPDNLMRTANRHRQKMRPLDPKPDELDFEIDNEFIKADQFLVDDVRIDGARHLVFGTTEQLQHLARARRWFMDGTFKVVSRPFYQLASIHAFVKKDDDVKQVPLLFILMSRRQKRDYVAVFQAILRKLQPDEPNVEWIMIDFEIAAWQAIREVFRRVLIRGCVFHWTGVYKKVINLGLSTAYSEGGDVFSFIRKILALPYLPAEHIIPAFEELSSLAAQGSSEAVNRLLEYVDSTWVNGNVWKPENWSVFRETVRTNNDVEGWHRGLNSRANGSKLSFYVLVPLLLNEANDVTVTVRLVSENLVTRNQRLKYKRVHGRLFELWDKYEDDNNYTTSKLLREASRLAGLGPVPITVEDQE